MLLQCFNRSLSYHPDYRCFFPELRHFFWIRNIQIYSKLLSSIVDGRLSTASVLFGFFFLCGKHCLVFSFKIITILICLQRLNLQIHFYSLNCICHRTTTTHSTWPYFSNNLISFRKLHTNFNDVKLISFATQFKHFGNFFQALL